MRRDGVPLTISGDCKNFEKELLGHRVRLLLIRWAARARRSGWQARQELVGRFPAWPVSIGHERQHADAGLYKKCLLFNGERSPHERDGCDAETVKAEDRPISLDEDQVLGARDTVQIEKNATLWNLRGRSYFGTPSGSSSLAQRPVYATSTPCSSWIGMQIRPAGAVAAVPEPEGCGELRIDVSSCQVWMRRIEREPKRQRPQSIGGSSSRRLALPPARGTACRAVSDTSSIRSAASWIDTFSI